MGNRLKRLVRGGSDRSKMTKATRFIFVGEGDQMGLGLAWRQLFL